MLELVGSLTLLAGVGGISVFEHHRRARRRAFEVIATDDDVSAAGMATDSVLRRWWWAPPAAALLAFAALFVGLNVPLSYALALSGVVALLAVVLDAMRVTRLRNKLESQLADSIALMVAALSVGTSLTQALENAHAEMSRPLSRVFDDVVGRIRLGDEPVDVMYALQHRVPLETFRLFAVALAINWKVGGSLAHTLAKVERTIRDRIETSRRIQAMSSQAQVSVAGVLVATYLIAALVWRNDPQRMAAFLQSVLGQLLVSGALLMQALGILWIAAICRSRF